GERREPEPRSGSRSASMNSASSANVQAANSKLLAVSAVKPAKPTAPSATAPTARTATIISDRPGLGMRVSFSAPRQRTHAQQQRQQRDAQEEADVRQIDRADRERLEMNGQRQIDDQLVERARQQPAEIVDDPEQQKDTERDQRSDHLVAGERGSEQAGADERSAEQQETKIAAINRAEIRIAEQAEDPRIR